MTILKELELQKEVQDNIVDAFNKLRQSEACIVGDVIAVLKRSDTYLGKPEELINHNNDTLYIVFKPTKLAKVCGINLDVISNKENTIKFIPIETLLYRSFEFNFLYTQMILNRDTWLGITQECEDLFTRFTQECTLDRNYKLKYKKESTIAYCVWQDILKGKFKTKEALFDRLYLVTHLLGRVYFCDGMAMIDDFIRCYEAEEIIEVVKERINKIHAHNLKVIESFDLKRDNTDPKLENYTKVYKLLTGEEA